MPLYKKRPDPIGTPFRNPLVTPGKATPSTGSAVLLPLVFAASLLVHGGVFVSVSSLVSDGPKEKVAQVVRISDIPKPPTAPVVEEKKPEPVKPPEPKKIVKERKPRVRNDETKPTPPEGAPPPPQEIRGGLTDSLAPKGPGTGIAVAEGNSAEVGVDAQAARRPPPPPAPGRAPEPDPDAVPVSEAAADVPAKCPPVREIPITDDAANAGITSGRIVVEIVVSSNGSILDAKIKEGTGFDIDKLALAEVRKLKCTPASVAGKAVAAKRKLFEIPIVL